LLLDHLIEVARRASRFAGKFSMASCGYACGLWHDAGKGTKCWMDYLVQAPEVGDKKHVKTVPHAPVSVDLPPENRAKTGVGKPV
jgi:hypothetical protein